MFKASKGKFLVIGVDTFSNEDWQEGTFDDLDLAIQHADKQVEDKEMLKMCIYDDEGMNWYECGYYGSKEMDEITDEFLGDI